jgi:hypothetical protein
MSWIGRIKILIELVPVVAVDKQTQGSIPAHRDRVRNNATTSPGALENGAIRSYQLQSSRCRFCLQKLHICPIDSTGGHILLLYSQR